MSAGARSAPFPWSVLGVDAVGGVAAAAALAVRQASEYDGRWVAVLEKGAVMRLSPVPRESDFSSRLRSLAVASRIGVWLAAASRSRS